MEPTMMRVASVGTVAIALFAFMAGCLGEARDDPNAASVLSSDTGPPVPIEPRAERPEWRAGDWWTWDVTGRDFGTRTITTLVAKAPGGSYEIGVAEVQPALDVFTFHLPPVGVVDASDLSWIVHEEPSRLLDFPLTDGKTWTGSFEGREMDLLATREGGSFHVTSTYAGTDEPGPRLVYDPAVGQMTEIAIHYGSEVPFSRAVLTAHGIDYRGAVHVLEPLDKFFGVGVGPPQPPTPPGAFQSSAEKTWLVFGCYLGGDAGRYEIEFVPPLGNEESETCTFDRLASGFEQTTQVRHRASVPGEWTVVYRVAGDGYAEAEVLGARESACRLGEPTGDEAVDDLPPCA